MIQQKRRLIFLYKQKSEILEKLQRYDEACLFYDKALSTLEKLPISRQRLPLYKKIKLEIKSALLKIRIRDEIE